jgi:hypothetical protein
VFSLQLSAANALLLRLPTTLPMVVFAHKQLKLAPFYLKRYHAPTVVMLKFRRCSDGL